MMTGAVVIVRQINSSDLLSPFRCHSHCLGDDHTQETSAFTFTSFKMKVAERNQAGFCESGSDFTLFWIRTGKHSYC